MLVFFLILIAIIFLLLINPILFWCAFIPFAVVLAIAIIKTVNK